MSIELKNIDLSNVTVQEQLEKLIEEDTEYYNALIKYLLWCTNVNEGDGDKLRKNVIEELFDVIQANMGVLQLLFNITAEELMDHYNKYHLEKLKNRPR